MVEYVEIPLTQGKVARVSPEDVERVNQYKWCAHRKPRRVDQWYAVRKSEGRVIKMHRFLCDLTDPAMQVDHRDGDGLNNVRSNLRVCTNQQNQMNQRPQSGCSSRWKGVYWSTARRKWRAHISTGGKQRSLGEFDSEVEAARQYNAVAFILFREFANLNEGIDA